MLIRTILLAVVGLSGGFMVAGGIFAFITMIGIIPRFASRTGTASYVPLYEDCVVIGGTIGNLAYIYRFPIPIGWVGILMYGVFSGMFVGCLAIALAEVLDTIPIFTRRIKMTKGAPYVLLGLALGKGLGSLLQFFYDK